LYLQLIIYNNHVLIIKIIIIITILVFFNPYGVVTQLTTLYFCILVIISPWGWPQQQPEKTTITEVDINIITMVRGLSSFENNNKVISGFHRASLLSVTFINQLMHSIITVVDVKILLHKSLKDTH
jgi:hypothetical protein